MNTCRNRRCKAQIEEPCLMCQPCFDLLPIEMVRALTAGRRGGTPAFLRATLAAIYAVELIQRKGITST